MDKLILERGKKFNSWMIIDDVTIKKNNITHWKCQCDCGRIDFLPLNNLMNGHSTKCRTCSNIETGKKMRKGVGKISGEMWSLLKSRIKRKNIEFEIEINEAWELFQKQHGLCFLTGKEIKLTGYPYLKEETTAELTMISPENGFKKGNLVWVHKDIECIKKNLPLPKFLEKISEIKEIVD